MKVFAGLLALAVVASAVTSDSYRSDRQYEYTYKSHSLSGIPLVSNERTGIYLSTKVQLYFETDEKVVLQLAEPEIRQVASDETDRPNWHESSRVPDLHEVEVSDNYSELPADVKDTVLTHLMRPIRLTLKRTNEIRDILANQEEPEWALNMKKAILNQFQVQKTIKAEKRQEHTILGEECEVSYDITKDEDNKKTITKTFSLDHCKTPSSFRDVIGLQGHRVQSEDDVMRSSFVSTHKVTEVNNRYLVREAVSEGRITLRPFNPEHGEMITFTRQELYFTAEVSKTIKVPTDVVKRCDSLFSHMQSNNLFADVYTQIVSETEKVEIIKKLVVESFEKLSSDSKPEMKSETTQEMMHAIKLMRTLTNKDSFKQLITFFWTPERQEMRPMFVSAMSFCGSPALIEVLPEIKEKLTTYEMNMILTTLPATHVPSKETLFQLKNLYTAVEEETTCRQLLLVLGAQVHDLCKPIKPGQFKPRSECDQHTRDLAKQFFLDEYKKTTSETRKLVVLKAIGNSGLDMSDFLRSQIQYDTLPTHLRENAIYAMRRCDKELTIRDTLLPVYRNEQNMYPVELRIAAFNVLIERIPTEEMLNTLVGRLNEEENRQVGNYVYSYINNLIQLPTCYSPSKNLTIAAQTVLPTIQRFEDGIWYSKNMQFLISSMSRRFAEFFEINMINSPSQSLPRSANLKLAKYFAGFYMEVLETGFRFEGLDKLVKEYINYMQPSSDLIKVLAGDRFQREIVVIKSILNEDDIKDKKIEETKGYFFLKTLGNEIGVFTTEDYSLSDIKERLSSWTTLDSQVDYFDVKPLLQATIKVQSLIGMPVVADWSAVTVLRLRSEKNSDATEQIISRSFSPRFMIQSAARMGVDMGLFKTTVGQSMHIKLTTPFNIRAEYSEKKMELEMYFNTDSRMFQKEMLEIESMPMFVTEVMHSKDNTYKTEKREMTLPQLQMPFKMEREYYGVRYIVEHHKQDFTRALPAFPFCGRHLIRLEWTDKPLPIGAKALFTYNKDNTNKYTYSGLFTWNPRIETRKLELNTVFSYKTEESRPIVSVEIEPRWQSKVYRMFATLEVLSGKINPAFSWVEAAEDKPIEYTIRAQWGENKEFDPKSEDLVVKTLVKKSDLQKYFEVQDAEIEDSDCYKCEQEKQQWRSIECERCIYKRSWLSRLDSKVFITREKAYEFEYLKPVLTYLAYPYYNMWESYSESDRDMHSTLTTSERSLLNYRMSHVTSDELVSYRLVHDIHPYFTQHNVTVYYNDKKVVFTDMPLIPAFRRLYNLPLNRLTDIFTDRFNRPNYGKCVVDELNKVRTLDTVVYELKKEQDCEQVLVKDVTEDREFEITTTLLADNKRSLKAHFGESMVEMKKTSDSYEVKINNLPKQWADDKIETDDVRIVRVPVKTPEGRDTYKIELFSKKYMITCELLDQLVSVNMPFWYKNQLTGICGDFNGELKHELKLPNGRIAESISEFVKSQSAKACRDSRH